MAKFIFEMPDDMAVMVEAFRVKRGHKSTAVAVRELISTGFEVAGSLGVFEKGPDGLRALSEEETDLRLGGRKPRGIRMPEPSEPLKVGDVVSTAAGSGRVLSTNTDRLRMPKAAPGARLKGSKKC